MKRSQEKHTSLMNQKSLESICIKQQLAIDSLTSLCNEILQELAMYREVDAEESLLKQSEDDYKI